MFLSEISFKIFYMRLIYFEHLLIGYIMIYLIIISLSKFKRDFNDF